MTFDASQLENFVLLASAVTLLAILAVRISYRAGLPSLLLYLLMGVALGESGLGIAFEDAQLAQDLGFVALAVILAEGGVTTSWPEVRHSMKLGVSLATVGVAISVTVVAIGAHFLLGMRWELAVLLGAVTSPTDAAAVFSVLRVVPLPKRLTGALEAESGLNDAPTVVLVTLISSGAVGGTGAFETVGIIAFELVVGTLIGLACGFGGAWLMRRAALPSSGLYPLAVSPSASWGTAEPRSPTPPGSPRSTSPPWCSATASCRTGRAIRSFAEGVAWLAQIGLFVMLGLLLSPDEITVDTVFLAVGAGLILTFVARPVSVLVSAVVSPLPWRELSFLSWAGLRGAVPIVLTTIPLAGGVEDSRRLFGTVFVMVVIYTLLTGPTLPLVAKVLKVARRSEPRGLEVEVAPLERVAADLLQVTISPVSKMHGVEVGELRLPVGASVSLVIRAGQILVPERRTVLRHGDDLLVVTPRKLREQTEERLRQVSSSGRLAQWLSRAPREEH